jgi:hypothetical protein
MTTRSFLIVQTLTLTTTSSLIEEEGTHGLRDDVCVFQNYLCSEAGKDSVA